MKTVKYDAILPQIAFPCLVGRILGLGCGERLTLIGIGREVVRDVLRSDMVRSRSALLLAPAGSRTSEAILDHLLDDLAELALARWPRWYGRDESSADGLLEHEIANPLVSAPWLRAAVKRAGASHRPRFRKVARRVEFLQLMLAVDPSNPVLIASLDVDLGGQAAATVQALEWCTGQGASVVVTMPIRPPFVSPYDRILYGAIEVVTTDEPVKTRFIASVGKAHPASVVEQRVEAALRADAELGHLFQCNQILSLNSLGMAPRVDLLWREGRVVVELDGPEHRSDPQFCNDRHRDYELLVAGYLVLRITNDQVETDLPRAIEKIRAVVRFRHSNEGSIS
jgi:very-short-patch-repair endonuclease